jgi:hypothetical protein
VNQLVKHDTDKPFDFFTRQLLGSTPPEWNAAAWPRRTSSSEARH